MVDALRLSTLRKLRVDMMDALRLSTLRKFRVDMVDALRLSTLPVLSRVDKERSDASTSNADPFYPCYATME